MTLPPHLLGMQNNDFMSTTPNYGHRATQSFAVKPSVNGMNGGFHTSQQSVGGIAGFAERQQRNNIQPINTNRAAATGYNANDLQTPGTAYDMNFTPLLPSQLLMGSPFQAGSPTTFQSPHFQSFPTFSQQDANGRLNQSQMNQAQNPFHHIPGFSPPGHNQLASPPAMGSGSYFGLPAPTPGFSPLNGGGMGYVNPMQVTSGVAQGTSRTVYLGNIPPETSAEEILGHVRSGQIESVRLLPDKNCAFISFLDGSSATHFHSDAILKKLSIKGQDIKIGWGKPSSVPTSVAIAVQQSGASRNVYLGNLPEEITDEEVREDLSKFGPIDTIKIVREKSIGFVHFLSIGNAIKAVTQLPQEPKWHAPRRVYYGKDRCAYVSKTQQQNAAQYLGIAPGYAHVLNGADRDLITSALAQQSVAAAAVATTAGGVNNLGNRTVYLGNIHPETTLEEICNVVRGGLLHHVRYIPDKHICFVTFIDPTSAASFYALSNLQGLMIHNRRLKIGWGKHSGALPPAIALAVSGGASRNVYVGNLDESWHEERLRQDFQEYGEIELVNTLREKNCAFVNFTNIANAIKAIEAIRGKEDYKRFKVNFGKDRCGNAPRHNHKEQHLEMSMSPSPINGLAPSRTQNSISPISSGANAGGAYNPMHGPTASTVFNTGSNNPLTMYLAATQQQNAQGAGQELQDQRHDSSPSEYLPHSHQTQPSSHLSTQQAFYNSPNEVSGARSSGLEAANAHAYGHGSHQSVSFANGVPMNSYSNSRMNQHSRTVSLPAFSLQQAQVNQHNSILGGLGSGLAGFATYGLGVSNEGSLPGWAEEEVA